MDGESNLQLSQFQHPPDGVKNPLKFQNLQSPQDGQTKSQLSLSAIKAVDQEAQTTLGMTGHQDESERIMIRIGTLQIRVAGLNLIRLNLPDGARKPKRHRPHQVGEPSVRFQRRLSPQVGTTMKVHLRETTYRKTRNILEEVVIVQEMIGLSEVTEENMKEKDIFDLCQQSRSSANLLQDLIGTLCLQEVQSIPRKDGATLRKRLTL
jgi:hypothetical protein